MRPLTFNLKQLLEPPWTGDILEHHTYMAKGRGEKGNRKKEKEGGWQEEKLRASVVDC